LLSYYRNTLIHVFAMEAFVACSMSAFGHQLAWKEGVSIERLWKETQFLMRMCQKEFILKDIVTNMKEFRDLLDLMTQRGIYEINGDKIKVCRNNYFFFGNFIILELYFVIFDRKHSMHIYFRVFFTNFFSAG